MKGVRCMGLPAGVPADCFHTLGCDARVGTYRACAFCKVEIAYCAEHGGDGRAAIEMLNHMNGHHELADNARAE